MRDQEDAEQRAVRLATDRDHHALVRVLLFGFCTHMVSILILPRREITNLALNLGLSFCCLALSNRFQVRDQEDAEHRDVRLATDRDRHALVRDLFTVYNHVFVRICQPS